ncbi:MAG: DoxX family membrane protein [SAR202 cluster bacterium]|nr:DoxX family membrane protein [SAR202 cluster bacterium]
MVFLLSAAGKVFAPRRFATDVRNYRILPAPAATAFAWALPYIEIALGVMLMTGVQPRLAAAISAIFIVAFMVAVAVAMARKFNLTCTCFGLLYREKVGWKTQARDAVLLAMAVYVVILEDGTLSFGYLASNVTQLGNAIGIVITVVALVASVLVLAWTMNESRKGKFAA